jgi:hypothetical protein
VPSNVLSLAAARKIRGSNVLHRLPSFVSEMSDTDIMTEYMEVFFDVKSGAALVVDCYKTAFTNT